jgi:hypothetical protein
VFSQSRGAPGGTAVAAGALMRLLLLPALLTLACTADPVAEGQDLPVTIEATGTLTILGPIRDRAGDDHVPVPGVKVTLSGPVNATTFSNANGVYRFPNLPSGTYTLKPSKSGASFVPTSRSVTLSGAGTVRGFDCASGCGAAVASDADFKELVIVDPSVVGDARARSGVWSFGHLMQALTPAGMDPADFVQTWIDGFLDTAGPVNGFPVERRNTRALLDLWPRTGGKLDLAQAPFQLLAIVNRTDLHKDGDGEARFVYGLKPVIGDQAEGGFTVIFEFTLPTSSPSGGALSRLDWIRKWNSLTAKAFGSAYNSALQAITDQFVKASALADVRTNEVLMSPDEFWQLREFQRNAQGLLTLHTLAQTPDDGKNNTADLAAYLQSQRVELSGGFAAVPPALLGGQILENDQRWEVDDSFGVTEQTRSLFGGQTCNGCHNFETLQIGGFYHITPRTSDTAEGKVVTGQERLSIFLRTIDVPRRRRFIQNRLGCASNLSDCAAGAEPMVMPVFTPAGP